MGITLVTTSNLPNSSRSSWSCVLPAAAIEGDYIIIRIFFMYPKSAGYDPFPNLMADNGDGSMGYQAESFGTFSDSSTNRGGIVYYSKFIRDLSLDKPGVTTYTFALNDGKARSTSIHTSVWRGMHYYEMTDWVSSENAWSTPLGPFPVYEAGSMVMAGFMNNSTIGFTESVAGTVTLATGMVDTARVLHNYAIVGPPSTGRFWRSASDIMIGLMAVFRGDSTGPGWDHSYLIIPSSVYLGDGGFYCAIGYVYDDGWPMTASNTAGISNVRFYVWTTSSGQDDLVGHNGSVISWDSSRGYWEVWIPFSSHGNQIGEYNVHIYGYDMQGYNNILVATTVNVYSNVAPTVVIRDSSNNMVSNGQGISHGTTDNFLFKITASDANVGDTITYRVLLRGAVRTGYTNCTTGVQFDYTIPFSELVTGLNTIIVEIRDGAGATSSISFTVRVKNTPALSNRSVLTTMQALGYANASYDSLNAIKPSGYSRATVSLSEILGVLF